MSDNLTPGPRADRTGRRAEAARRVRSTPREARRSDERDGAVEGTTTTATDAVTERRADDGTEAGAPAARRQPAPPARARGRGRGRLPRDAARHLRPRR